MKTRVHTLVLLAGVLLAVTSGVAVAESYEPAAGTVEIGEDSGNRDEVTFYVPSDIEQPESFAKSAVRDANLPVREVRVDEDDATDAYTPVTVTTTLGDRAGLLTRRVTADTLSSLAVFEDSRLVVELAGVMTVTGTEQAVGSDGWDKQYAVSGDQDLTYTVPVWRVGLVGVVVLAAAVIPFVGCRWYGQRVVASDGTDEEKIHRLRKVTAIGMLPLTIGLVPVLFEIDLFPVTMMVVSGLAPWLTASEIAEMLLIVGAVMLPLVLAMVSVVLGVFPYDKQLRDTTIDARTGARKFLAGLAVAFLPMVVWFLVITKLPPGLLENQFVMLGLLAVFLGVVMALQPYLIVLLQDTRELTGPLRDRIDEFCSERGQSLRNVYRIDGQGNKLANALVAGTVPGFNYVFITDYLIEEFPEEEIEAIVAHELGHLEHRHLWYQGGLTLVVFGAWIVGYDRIGLGELFDQFGFYGFFLPFMGLLIVYLVVLRGWLAVRQEYEADAYAATQTGTETTVQALQRLGDANYQREDTGWLYNRLTLHPSIGDRVENLRDESVSDTRPEATEAD